MAEDREKEELPLYFILNLIQIYVRLTSLRFVMQTSAKNEQICSLGVVIYVNYSLALIELELCPDRPYGMPEHMASSLCERFD